MINIHVWYDGQGDILAVGHSPLTAHTDSPQLIPLSGEGQYHLSAHVHEGQLKDLHKTHRVDVGTKNLIEQRCGGTGPG